MNYGAINLARRRQQDSALAGLISDEARIASELQAQTGCTRTEALIAAKRALEHCEALTKQRTESTSVEVRSVNDPTFSESWTTVEAARDRVDELNRNLAHPAYFIA